jgi:hypothetical protein
MMKVILEQLNKLCGTEHDIFFGAKIPRKRLPMEIPKVKITDEGEIKRINSTRNPTICSKILQDFLISYGEYISYTW